MCQAGIAQRLLVLVGDRAAVAGDERRGDAAGASRQNGVDARGHRPAQFGNRQPDLARANHWRSARRDRLGPAIGIAHRADAIVKRGAARNRNRRARPVPAAASAPRSDAPMAGHQSLRSGAHRDAHQRGVRSGGRRRRATAPSVTRVLLPCVCANSTRPSMPAGPILRARTGARDKLGAHFASPKPRDAQPPAPARLRKTARCVAERRQRDKRQSRRHRRRSPRPAPREGWK